MKQKLTDEQHERIRTVERFYAKESLVAKYHVSRAYLLAVMCSDPFDVVIDDIAPKEKKVYVRELSKTKKEENYAAELTVRLGAAGYFR